MLFIFYYLERRYIHITIQTNKNMKHIQLLNACKNDLGNMKLLEAFFKANKMTASERNETISKAYTYQENKFRAAQGGVFGKVGSISKW